MTDHKETLQDILARIDSFALRCAQDEYTDSGEVWETFDAVRAECIVALGLRRVVSIESTCTASIVLSTLAELHSRCLDDPEDFAEVASTLIHALGEDKS